MGGDGGYGGNGSIYWTVQHRNNAGAAPLVPKRGRRRVNLVDRTEEPGPQDHTLDLTNPVMTTGYDPMQVPVGGNFTVTMRFSISPGRRDSIRQTLDKLITDAGEAMKQLDAGTDDLLISVDVPIIARPQPPSGPPNDPFEVSVHW